ncbi:MAG TPA: FAD:protein FMN transferase [Actinomycetes bacterium]|nr:FAD:protein FMN transferase [Actinomycetes bacterium]
MSASGVSFAGPGAWARFAHAEPVWGTVVSFDVRGPDDSGPFVAAAGEAVGEAVAFLHDVDAWFSTYRVDSPVTALRNGLLTMADVPSVVSEVLDECWRIRSLTNGAFDPWAVPGGVDPSGYVKGWAADVAADLLGRRGFRQVCVNAGGDVTCRGEQAPGEPWVVGIRHPECADEVVRTVVALDEAVATSGRYERGEHIHDPRQGRPAGLLDSATVVGPDGGLADALATALVVAGARGTQWFTELPGWSAYMVADGTATFFGPAFT